MGDELRSHTWLGDGGKNGFIARHHLRAMGLGTQQLTSKPVIGIANTWSELTPCNAHLRSLAEAVKRGVLEAGGLPLEFPVMSLGEPFLRPSSMLYRNLMALEVEESLRANPLDAAVLLTGCDKTTPAALMGAASVDLPAVMLTGGPMLNGKYRGKDVGSGTDIWRMTEALRAGEIAPEEFTEFESCLNRSAGHCMTMGTASTMASLAEALGMQLPGSAALPAVDSRRGALAEETGRLAVSLARERLRPSAILTRAAFENAVKVNAAIGGRARELALGNPRECVSEVLAATTSDGGHSIRPKINQCLLISQSPSCTRIAAVRMTRLISTHSGSRRSSKVRRSTSE